MLSPEQILAERVRAAVIAVFGEDFADTDPLIRPCRKLRRASRHDDGAPAVTMKDEET